MCRFVMYLGEPINLDTLLTKPINSLINQSYDAEERNPLNGDGFGVAWYVPEISPEPAVFKAETPAWNNRNLLHLARATRSECVLAHVRAASPGMPVTEINCHPFLSGNFAFMHNGVVGGFHTIRKPLLASLSDESFHVVEGSTDSEHLFALFLDCWRAAKKKGPLEAMADALEHTIARVLTLQHDHGITAESQLNLAISDGKRAVATRYTTGDPQRAITLYWHEGRRYVYKDGVGFMVDPDVRSDTVIIASEPLSEDTGWEPVAPNTMVLVQENRKVQLRSLPALAAAPPLRRRDASPGGASAARSLGVTARHAKVSTRKTRQGTRPVSAR
jgi:glutamine amidotransferase